MAVKQVSVRIAAEGGKQVKAELMDIGREGSRSFQQLDRSAGAARSGMQNLGFQVQDFAVQVAGGTDASRALAQQLPQLLSGFGLLGVALGTASAVAVPLAAMFFDVGSEAKSSAEAIRDMETSLKTLQDTSAVYTSTGLQEMIDKYGELNGAILLLTQRQRELAVDQAMDSARDAVAGLNATFDTLFSTRRGEIADLLGVELSVRQIDEFGNAIRTVNPQISEFERALEAVSTATTFADQADAIANVLTLLDQTAEKGGEYYTALVQSEGVTRQLANAGNGVNGWLDAAISGAKSFAATLWDAASASFSIGAAGSSRAALQTAASEKMVYSGRGADPRTFLEGQSNSFASPLFTVPTAPRGGGGGGGQSDDQRDAARIYDATRTAAEKYATELERLNQLQASGLITSDTYSRAVDDLKDKMGEAGDMAGTLEASFGDAFTSFVTGAKTAQDAVGDLLASLAETLANSAFKSIAGSLFGDAGIGGTIASLLGGGKAGGGPVAAGMSYMVGESGPELLTMGSNGYITPNNALRSGSGGGGVSISIDARGAVEGVAQQIDARLRQAIPDLLRQSVTANRAATARGY